ncbi:MAG: transposase [Planctomycetes bacterium]|nr:transposase [Planctomycetota bacterium]
MGDRHSPARIIALQRINLGKPQENGRHERMHPTLKAETANPPARNMRRQQRRFEQWTEEFNFERPHQVLDGSTPASAYEMSEHAYPGEVGDPEYPGHYETRRVGSNGLLKIRMVKVYLRRALSNELVGLVEVADGNCQVKFTGVELASYSERTKGGSRSGEAHVQAARASSTNNECHPSARFNKKSSLTPISLQQAEQVAGFQGSIAGSHSSGFPATRRGGGCGFPTRPTGAGG